MSWYITIVGSLAIVWASFCRLRHTDLSTRREVRWSIVAAAVSGCGVALYALCRAYDPGLPAAALIAAVAAMQVVSARAWSTGVPHIYTHPGETKP